MMFRSLDEYEYVRNQMRPTLEKCLADQGFVTLLWADIGWVRFFSKYAALHPTQFMRMKLFIWAGNNDRFDLMKELGFCPVSLESADILPGLQTGLTNALDTVPMYALAPQFRGPCPHMLEINFAHLGGAALITKTAWDSIPPPPSRQCGRRRSRPGPKWSNRAGQKPTKRWKPCRSAVWAAKWKRLLPAVAFLALYSGFATPVEAAAVTALYAFFVETITYGNLKITKDIPRAMADCGLQIGGVLLIWGVEPGVTDYMVGSEVVVRTGEWPPHTIHSPWVFLLLLNLFLLIVRCVMDMDAAIVIEVPLLVPLGVADHINPIHLGNVFLAKVELGYLPPPVGLNALISSYRFKKPLSKDLLAVLPIDIVLFIGVSLITYFPALTTWLPALLSH